VVISPWRKKQDSFLLRQPIVMAPLGADAQRRAVLGFFHAGVVKALFVMDYCRF